jgi:shikimate dehydrogenase
MGFEGASVTIPFKLDALHAAETRDPVAVSVGAANTLRRLHQAWEAANTDVEGFLAPLDARNPRGLDGLRAVVLGAGGSARAVVAGLAARGVHTAIAARRPEQAAEVAAAHGIEVAPWPPAPGSWDVLVNCTPLGGARRRGESPMAGATLDGRLVYDLTYGDGDSALIADARRAGCAVLDGLPMLVAQAERQFEWWTGQRPAPGVMRAAAWAASGRAEDRAVDDGTGREEAV